MSGPYRFWSNEAGYSDADWGRNLDSRRSTTGVVVLLNGAMVVWKSCKQPTVAISMMEAEYMSLTDAVKEIKWICQLFDELHYGITFRPFTILKTDNRCISIGQEPCTPHSVETHQHQASLYQGNNRSGNRLVGTHINKRYGCRFSHEASGACLPPEVFFSHWYEVGEALERHSFSVRFGIMFIVGSGKCYSIFILKYIWEMELGNKNWVGVLGLQLRIS